MGFNKHAWQDKFGREIDNANTMRRLDIGRKRINWINEVYDLITYKLDYTDINTSKNADSGLLRTSLSDYSIGKNTRLLLATIRNKVFVTSTKTKKATVTNSTMNVYNNYEGSANVSNTVSSIYQVFQGSDADNIQIDEYRYQQAIIPVTWNAGEAYLIWNMNMYFGSMNAVLANYYAEIIVRILGYIY